MSFTYIFNLESRQLLSGSGSDHDDDSKPAPDPAAFEAAKAAVMVDYQSLLSHYETNRAAVTAAIQVLKDHQTTFVAQQAEFRVQIKTAEQAIKTAHATYQADKGGMKAFWAPIIHARQLDVDTVTEGETLEEQAQDLADLQQDKRQAKSDLRALDATWRSTYDDLDDVVDDLRDDMKDASRDYKREKRVDEQAVRAAQRTLKNVFQSDRKILDREIKTYKKQGFSVAELDLPKLPKV